METPTLAGTLAEQVAQVLPLAKADSILIGHDMGGVVAALVALQTPVSAVVLTGTALGPYWSVVRASAWPLLWRTFYAKHAGKYFVAGAVAAEHRAEALRVFPGADPIEMREIARSMVVPAQLGQKLAERTRVHLIWGTRDRWYPPAVAHAVARATRSHIHWVDGGHFVMWENPEAYSRALCALELE